MLANAAVQRINTVSKSLALQPWLVCISAAMFFFYEFIQMGMFNPLSLQLMRDFGINATQLGHLSSTYFYGDVTFLFFAGILLDIISPRRIILSGSILCVIATVMFALSKTTFVLGLSHFIAGVGNAFCFLTIIMLASRWFPPKKMALVIGLSVTLAMLGGVFSQTPLSLLAQTFGWRHAVLLDALLGVGIIALIWFFVQDNPDYAKPVTKQANNKSTGDHSVSSVLQGVKTAIYNRQNWLGGLYTSMINLPIFLIGDLYGGMYFIQVHHMSHTQATMISSMVFWGTIVGSPVIGWISDRIGLRRSPMIIGAILSLIVMLAIMFVPSLGFASYIVLLFALGFFTSSQIVSYPLIAESNSKTITGAATGLASVLIMGGGAVFQPLFGKLMDLNWDGTTVAGVPVYSSHDYLLGMSIMPIAILVGLISALLIRETYCQPVDVSTINTSV